MIDFAGIGAQKGGTTWLCERLAWHPQVRFPAGKEIDFWDQHLHCGKNWWTALFPGTASDVRQGEITPKPIRLRKALLDPNERKRAFRAKESA